ncbi:MAG: ATP-binding cassette domain-containing protein [Eubacterium sp.]|nr:ATP-binding cassette domain-containing protein [Eubacterium sp.]
MSITVDLSKNYGSFHLDVRFSAESRRIGILGASGSGKSMTLRMIAGIISPDSGLVQIGTDCFYDSGRRINVRPQARKIGYLFQNYALFPTMTVAQNIACGVQGTKKQKQARAEEMIREFHLERLGGRLPSELSGGQQQRAALARIMAYEPDVILLDEPFSALDVYLKDQMQQELVQFLDTYPGIIIMVSHDRDEIYRICEELVIIDEGKTVISGRTKDIFADPQSRTAATLTGCKNFSAAARIDDHTFRAEDWGITVHTQKVLPDSFDCIGYRAHEFEPVWGAQKENCIPVHVSGCAELQFEKKFYINTKAEGSSETAPVKWFAQRNVWDELEQKGMPDWLRIQEEHILFLQQRRCSC